MQNVTDVDDPLLERANRDGEDWRDLADARDRLLPLRHDRPAGAAAGAYVGAVEALPLIEEFNRTLANRGSLYELEGDMYFSRAADPAFGSVSGLDTETMIRLSAENGGDPCRPGKKDPLDPMVWLAERPGEPSWPSEFGPGRPGWHVECAAIATHYLGTDVRRPGGRPRPDLPAPRDERLARRVALDGTGEAPFARRYAHAGMVRLDGEKMSKSRGNLVFVSKLLAAGQRPDGGAAGDHLAPLPGGLGLDRRWPRRGGRAAGDVAGGCRSGLRPGRSRRRRRRCGHCQRCRGAVRGRFGGAGRAPASAGRRPGHAGDDRPARRVGRRRAGRTRPGSGALAARPSTRCSASRSEVGGVQGSGALISAGSGCPVPARSGAEAGHVGVRQPAGGRPRDSRGRPVPPCT